MKKFAAINTILLSDCPLQYARGTEIYNLCQPLCCGKKIAIIINATNTGHNLKGLEVPAKSIFEQAESVDKLNLTCLNLNVILNYDVLLILGGDIGELLKLTVDNNFKKALSNFYTKGGNVIAYSAGSMIFDTDLSYCYKVKHGTSPMYETMPQNTKGLGWHNLKILPHANRKDDRMVKILAACREYEKKGVKLLYLNDGEYLLKTFN